MNPLNIHVPTTRLLAPSNIGAVPDHADHPGKAADYAAFPSEINLGLQFNTCIDAFTGLPSNDCAS